jgi:phosphohistidine phosphatase SixA
MAAAGTGDGVTGRAWIGRLAFAAAVSLLLAAPARGDDALWARLREGGLVVMIRHATAPGIGDPPGMRIGDCSTQRNLSEEGREEARRIGAAFRRERVPVADVRSSAWCRCRDTAMLAFGRYEVWPAIGSFFGDRSVESARTAAVRALRAAPGTNIVLVTHQVNVTAATGVYPASGEMVVLEPSGSGALTVLGRIPPGQL